MFFQYTWLAESLRQGAQKGFGTREHALKSLANLAVSDQWPYHRVLNFEEQAQDIMSTGNFEAVFLAPWVRDQSSWEQYQSSVVTGADDRQIQGVDDNVVNNSSTILPIWQIAHGGNIADHTSFGINSNLLNLTVIREAVDALQTSKIYFGDLPTELLPLGWTSAAFLMEPFRIGHSTDSTIAGYALAVVSWEKAFAEILPPGSESMLVRIGSTIKVDTFAPKAVQVMGPEALLLEASVPESDGHCFEYVCFHQYWFHICIEPVDSARSAGSHLYVGVALIAVVVVWILFCVYDTLLFRAQRELIEAADQSLAVVSSLFPKNFQDRLLEKEKPKSKAEKGVDDTRNASAKELLEGSTHSIFNAKRGLTRVKSSLTNFLHENSEHSESAGLDYLSKTKPIADLFPETTISEFAGSRRREICFLLTQCFQLLLRSVWRLGRIYRLEFG